MKRVYVVELQEKSGLSKGYRVYLAVKLLVNWITRSLC